MFERKLPPADRDRTPSIEAWTSVGLDEEGVRILTRALESAFNWKPMEALRLRPEDSLWEIYWYYYPKKGILAAAWDECDLETLVLLLGRVSDPEACELKLPPETTLGDLAQVVAARRDRDCSCGCHQGVPMFHFAACCTPCQSCGVSVGRGRHHKCQPAALGPGQEAQ